MRVPNNFAIANKDLLTAPFYFVEQILMNMAPNGTLDVVFDRNKERETQSSTIMNVFARSTFIFSILSVLRREFAQRTKKTAPRHGTCEKTTRLFALTQKTLIAIIATIGWLAVSRLWEDHKIRNRYCTKCRYGVGET